jgi:probable rRNA maturation factor
LIEVEVEDAAWTAAEPRAEALARAAAEGVLEILGPPPQAEEMEILSPGGGGPKGRRGLTAAAPATLPLNSLSRFATAPPGGEHLVVLLTDDAAVRELNGRFRGQDKPTNVLSFPAAANPEGHLGDLALAYGVCAREAAEQGKTLAAHLQHLVAHGVLHLLGYDHMTEPEAREMEDLERAVLAGLGIADPYAPAEGDHG